MNTNDDTLFSAQVQVQSSQVEAHIRDRRGDTTGLFAELAEQERQQLAQDAWSIGLRALGNAYSQARESRLSEVGESLLGDMTRSLEEQLRVQQKTLQETLARFFDPSDGEMSKRFDAFVDDQGALAQFLQAQMGTQQGALARTLAQQVGAESELFKKLSPNEKEGLVRVLEGRLSAMFDANEKRLTNALDPLAENGAVARLMRTLRDEIQGAEEDRTKQLNKAVAALDANDENSLISKLGRETRAAQQTLLRSLNPQDPDSPIAAVQNTVKAMLEAHGVSQLKLAEAQEARQAELETMIRETVTRLDTRKQVEDASPRGGATFEDGVVAFLENNVRGGAYVVEATGSTTGCVRACKVGDAVISFTDESAFAGSRVVVEAKRDASYSVAKALQEMETAQKNRNAEVGLFVLSASHANENFPEFARYGSNILLTWDPEDASTFPNFRAALLAGLAMATRRRNEADEGDLTALRDIEKRIEDERTRIGRMRKANERISSNSEVVRDELKKAEKKFGTLLTKAVATLRALNVELREEAAEVATPITLPVASESQETDEVTGVGLRSPRTGTDQ